MENTPNKLSYKAILIAAFVAFVISGVWYTLWGNVLIEFSAASAADAVNQSMAPQKMIVEVVRTVVVTFTFAWLTSVAGINSYYMALKSGLIIWAGFPLMILLGSVIHENVPWQLASLHAGDWLIKPLVILLILTHFNIKRNAKGKIPNQTP